MQSSLQHVQQTCLLVREKEVDLKVLEGFESAACANDGRK